MFYNGWIRWLVAVLLLGIGVTAQGFDAQQTDQLIIKYRDSGQYRTKLDGPTKAARRVSALTGIQAQHKRTIDATHRTHVIKFSKALSVQQLQRYAQQLMAQDAAIEYAEPDVWRYPLSITPNDTDFNQQWHLSSSDDYPGAANVVNAWDITKGSPDIVVALLDAGVTNHADLQPSLVGGEAEKSGYDMVSDETIANDGDGRDADPSNPGAAVSGNFDSLWHGTHVGGIIAARPNNGEFVAGVGWRTRLSVVRILSEDGGYLSDQVSGLRWASGESIPGVPENSRPAHIVNISAGLTYWQECSNSEQEAINDLRDRGVTVVVAVGNDNRNVEGSPPANCEGVIAVTGVMPDGARAPYANYGELNDIAAPSEKIYSTINTGSRAPEADGGKTISGTSQAAPQVAGTLALMLAANDKLLDENVVAKAELPGFLEDKLKQSVRSFPTDIDGSDDPRGCNKNQEIPCVCRKTTCGEGLLDALQAVKSVSSAPVAVPGDDHEVEAGSTVVLDGSESHDDEFGGRVVGYQWEQVSGPDVVLENADQAVAQFDVPAVAAGDTVFGFELTVTDDTGLQGRDTVSLSLLGGEVAGSNAAENSGGGGSLGLGWLLCLGMLGCFRLLTRNGRAVI